MIPQEEQVPTIVCPFQASQSESSPLTFHLPFGFSMLPPSSKDLFQPNEPPAKKFKPSHFIRQRERERNGNQSESSEEEEKELDEEQEALLRKERMEANLRMRKTFSELKEVLKEGIVEETYHNGGGKVLHVYPDLFPPLKKDVFEELAIQIMELMLREDEEGCSLYCFGIVHRGAVDQPNFLRHIAEKYPKTEIVKEEFGQRRMTEVIPIRKFLEQVDLTYCSGTHRAGTMRNISLVGCQKEETGGYFEDILEMMAGNPFLREALPWGKLSTHITLEPAESNDGPIMWTCPGEQYVNISDLHSPGSSSLSKRKRTVLDRLSSQGRNEKQREKLVEDRTGCHADMADYSPDRHPVAAVGFVQGIKRESEYDLKDIVAFHADDMKRVGEICGLYFEEEAKDQLIDKTFWATEAKLNELRRLGIRFAKVRLQANDIYCIPRKVVHQFQTVCGCTSVTWHLKHYTYYHDQKISGAAQPQTNYKKRPKKNFGLSGK